ncbi:MAG TPA: TatD family hydrolase [Tepidisphaeraceae bacterium]|jgi:TatD DNase family protein
MTDSHCHLTDERLGDQLEAVIARANEVGVTRLVTIGTDLEDSARCIEICRSYPNVRCAVGLHPGSISEHEFSISKLAELSQQPDVVAIGEIGLDYFWCKEPAQQEAQKKVFIEQLELATAMAMPVVIHCREAVSDCLAIMKDFPQVLAVYHCFTGTPEEARSILNAGYWLGFTGAVTFKKNDQLREVAKFTPADRLLVETDAPYLTPEPMRKQKTNEPAMVVHVARVVAEMRGISIEKLEAITDTNAQKFFGWK